MPDLNNGLKHDNHGDDDSSSGKSMILELLMCHSEPISNSLEIPKEWRGLDDPLAQFKRVFDETLFISEIPKTTDIEVAIAITPSEVKQLVSLLGDEFCEELAHPHIVPTGKFDLRLKGKQKSAQVDILIKDF